ncbi:hypothetical protein BGL34_00945 [Fructilactobacillus lindneri]|uniref:Glutamate--cysteine ligase n=2 Tax=Fructilactobacillus lindneri TaxID=53444 RepID=A0A0R2JPL0_9LACO|nr:hypothetical protein [Fructilactobacillus lindneri]ANZ58256.1 hypothetical protein AYR60_05635 [Fructilactobacillus lindneri]ANZ59578.1 hypothetical protein AYR59_05890 [Fructilactobacillus lindneri]KRN79083.1 glutamate--cysteine ligase [Fructilactobacillus lindneri DSM 20690 = JCM 11027]POH04026.1 hypothetical protein BGL32_01475 [Fructilactobacillus lindneri]POH04732.1 hypothetical protein BGL33_00420 [Fructilactobacillus lindneri]
MKEKMDYDTYQALFKGLIGIEIEGNRFDVKLNSLSRYEHSNDLGDRRSQPYFQNDFTECMEELVTAPHSTNGKVINHLHSLQSILQNDLQQNEIIWPLSMPPKLTSADLAFLKTTSKNRPWYQSYLDNLMHKYGPYRQLIAGVHVNYSPNEKIVDYFQKKHQITARKKAKNELLFKIGQQIVGYRWLLTYLFGATPVSENLNDTVPQNIRKKEPFRSIRASEYGYTNFPDVHVSYVTLDGFINDIVKSVKDGKLSSSSEFYGPVRLKGTNKIEDVIKKGAKYVEFRIFDDNPFSINGVTLQSLNFVHLLVIDELITDKSWNKFELNQAHHDNQYTALQHPYDDLPVDLKNKALELLNRLDFLIKNAPENLQSQLEQTVKSARKDILNPKKTVAGQLIPFIRNGSLEKFGIEQGLKYKDDFSRETLAEKFPGIPKNLIQSYIQAHKLGFKVKLSNDDNLIVNINGKKHELSQNENLLNYIVVN